MDKRLVKLFEEYTEDIKKTYDAVGIAVSVFDKENVLYRKNFGFRDLEKQLPIDDDTIFGCASVTKSFTALSIMLLQDRGLLDVEDPVSKYIPEFTDPQEKPVLIKHLLSHAGGFFPLKRILVEHVATDLGVWNGGKDEFAYDRALAEEGAKQVAGRLSSQTSFTGLPGERMSYCNDGFGVLSEIIRRVGGENSYSEFLEKNILEPLGMTRSSASFVAPLADPNHATLYKHSAGKLTGGWDFYDNAFVLNGGGAMKSTISDLTSYVRMYMNGGKPLVNKAVVAEMYRPRQHYRYMNWYGYGVSMTTVDNFTVNQHGGSLTGVSSNFAWSPELGVGVVVFCNTSGVPVSLLSDAAFRMAAGHDPVPAPCTLRCEWTEEQKLAVCGEYISGEGDGLTIGMKEGCLCVSEDGKQVDYFTAASDMLMVKRPFKNSDAIFLSDDDGKVWGVRYGGRIIPKKQ